MCGGERRGSGWFGERLDPGQEMTVDLPYVPSPYREQTLNFAVGIGDGK